MSCGHIIDSRLLTSWSLVVLLIPIAYTVVRMHKTLYLCLVDLFKGSQVWNHKRRLDRCTSPPMRFWKLWYVLGLTGHLILLTCTVGAPIGGRISDAVLRRAKEERKGVWVPEDRLRGVWVGGLVLVPISVILAGFTTAYVDGMVGLVINLVCLFANGVGVGCLPNIFGTDASIH